MLFPFTLPAPRWRFTSRRRDDVQLTGRQPAHPPARGQLLIHAYPSPLSVPILQKPRPASIIPNRPAIAPLRKLRRAAGILNRLERGHARPPAATAVATGRSSVYRSSSASSSSRRRSVCASRPSENERGFIPQRASQEKARVPLTRTGSALSRRRFPADARR